MELPVLIERLPDEAGFTARLGGPFDLSAQAPTVDEARRQLALLLQRRLQEGAELQALVVSESAAVPAEGGWLPDDELTREWLEHVRQYRGECDEADRQRLLDEPGDRTGPS
jgi:hypothetical protein